MDDTNEDDNINPQNAATVACLVGIVNVTTGFIDLVGCVINRIRESGNLESLQDPRFLELVRLSEELQEISAEAQEILNFEGDGNG